MLKDFKLVNALLTFHIDVMTSNCFINEQELYLRSDQNILLLLHAGRETENWLVGL